jgi:hypothetical protein
MAETVSSSRSTRRPRPSADNGKTKHRSARRPTAAPEVSAEQRRALIAEAAYLRAAQRGFRGGDPVADWLESEREVDALLSRSTD